ncbi:hypothetical protein DM01DRAFT_1404391 [Hesseltinella vesiculosa]|uniref:Uncharacterized protein n=1 Tax=Hesseltinella vesiculosa TaxID=101127 RepID=A0A1X2GUH0_9FUNG|nr:hypothetical protein DM01DRAFT_1404391 [Hesseltinella vesiculosa]
MRSTDEIYEDSQQALYLLADVWEGMLKVLEEAGQASSQSFTTEPDLTHLQQCRKQYEDILRKLKGKVAKIQNDRHVLDQQEQQSDTDPSLLEKQAALRQTAQQLSECLKRMLGQTSALQFEVDMILSSSDMHSVQHQQ